MRILSIDDRKIRCKYDEETGDFKEIKRKPTYNLIVELTQEEYQTIAFYLELDNRNGIKAKIELPEHLSEEE